MATPEMTLDAMKRSRRPIQREIKKISEDIKDILKKEKMEDKDLDDIKSLHDMLVTECNSLAVWNQRIAEQLVVENAKEEDENQEYDECRKIKKEYLAIFRSLEKVLIPTRRDESPHGSEKSTYTTKSASCKLPKIEIPVFSGEHKDWLGWWAVFSRIDSREDLDAADKFTYLRQAIKSDTRAKDLVDRYPASAENYPLALKALQERFADKDILIDVYIRELVSLMMESAQNKSLRSKEKLELTTLFDKVETYLNALNTLGDIDKSHFLYPMVESCLPVSVIRAWQRSPLYSESPTSTDGAKRTKLERLLEFVASEVKGETRIALATKGRFAREETKGDDRRSRDKVLRRNRFKKNDDLPTAMGLVSLDDKEKCIFCDKTHPSTACSVASKLTLEEKRERIKKTGRCLKCVAGKHLARYCAEKVLCSTCGGLHQKILCPGKEKTAYSVVPPPSTPGPSFPAYVANPIAKPFQVPSQMSLSNFNASPEVLLPTLVVGIADAEGRVRRVRAAIDTMSGHTYITKKFVKDLKITPNGTATFKHAVFGGTTQIVEHFKYTVTLISHDGDFSMYVEVFDQDQIASGIPSVPTRGVFEELLKHGIKLSDHPCQRLQPVDLLIGGDIAGSLITGKKIQLEAGPTALETRFGWTVIGKTVKISTKDSSYFVENSLANLHAPEDMWKLEAIGITDPATKLSRAEEDAIAVQKFAKTVKRNPDGRYQVSLPWIDGHPPLPENRSVAQQRLVSATKKLKRQCMYYEYEKIFEEWLESGIIEEVKNCEEKNNVHYLPHRPVIKTESLTTKVRPVFDASCKQDPHGREVPSLNDCLVKGPNLLEKIPNNLLRFREDKVAAIADIRKAFLMIEIGENDRDVLRFLWWSSDGELRVFRHRRVVFGVNCSPFLLNAVIDHHLKNATTSKDEDIVKKLRSTLYVDNVAASFSSPKHYAEFKKRSTEILAEAKFDLRLWESNIDKEIGPGLAGVLGIKWNRMEDALYCDSSLESLNLVDTTKKTILSAIARIYDPIGMLAPVVLVPKQLFQECCRRKLAWDEKVPEDIHKEFLKWITPMKKLKDASIPRYIGVPTAESSVHVFVMPVMWATPLLLS